MSTLQFWNMLKLTVSSSSIEPEITSSKLTTFGLNKVLSESELLTPPSPKMPILFFMEERTIAISWLILMHQETKCLLSQEVFSSTVFSLKLLGQNWHRLRLLVLHRLRSFLQQDGRQEIKSWLLHLIQVANSSKKSKSLPSVETLLPSHLL